MTCGERLEHQHAGLRCRARRSARRTAARSGCLATARAMATRCCSPPESCAGKWSRRVAEADQRRAPRPASSAPARSRSPARRSLARSGSGSGCRTGTRSRRARAGSGSARASSPRVERLRRESARSPARRHVEAAEDVEQRRLAAARGAEQHDELAGPQIDSRRRAARGPRPRPPVDLRQPTAFEDRWRRGVAHERSGEAGGGLEVMVADLLEGVAGAQHARLVPPGADQLCADRQARGGEPARHRQRRHPGEREGEVEPVDLVRHASHVGALLDPRRRERAGGHEEQIAVLEGAAQRHTPLAGGGEPGGVVHPRHLAGQSVYNTPG